MANTPPEPPIRDRDNKKLLEDLCIGLRNVGVWDSELPGGDTVRNYIEETKMIHAELKRRGVDVDTRVSQLSDESGWLMGELLEDCLDFPKTLPYVKEAAGIGVTSAVGCVQKANLRQRQSGFCYARIVFIGC